MMKKILIGLMLAVPLTPASAQENETPNGGASAGALPVESALDKRVTLRFRGVTIGELLRYLSRETGADFTVGEDLAERRVTVYLSNAKLSKARGCPIPASGTVTRS